MLFCSVHSPPITQLLVSSDAQRTLHALGDLRCVERAAASGVTVLAERCGEIGAA